MGTVLDSAFDSVIHWQTVRELIEKIRRNCDTRCGRGSSLRRWGTAPSESPLP
jgi:hypothetical protein